MSADSYAPLLPSLPLHSLAKRPALSSTLRLKLEGSMSKGTPSPPPPYLGHSEIHCDKDER